MSEPSVRRYDDRTVDAVLELLSYAEDNLVSVVFEPDGEGWRISYATDWPAAAEYELQCKEVAVAHSLDIAATAALRPIMEYSDSYDRYQENRTKEKESRGA